MWGTDGVRVFTLDDGWGWIFASVEQERGVRGVARVQSREPLRGTRSDCARAEDGSLDADVARGLALRMDHGVSTCQIPQADPVLGDPPQLRLCRGTETNGVAER